MPKLLADKVIAVTGAGKGLGRAYALYFAELGARVIVNNRRHPGESSGSADETVRTIREAGGTAIAEHSDVEDENSGERLLEAAIENFGQMDGLVANAGIMEGVSFARQTPQQFADVIAINLFGTVNVVRPVFRHMLGTHSGRIVVSTSSAGLFGEFGLPAYSTSKAAVIGFMRSLSLEGGLKGVCVNALAPYATTAMTEAHLSDDLRAVTDTAAVAPAAAWLVSDSCTVNGQTYIAAGGHLSHAEMRTTQTVRLPEMAGEDWQGLSALPHDRSFESAGQHFGAFARDLLNR